MGKNKHPLEVPGYEGRLDELVDFIVGKLRYDRTLEFHQLLSKRYQFESQRELDIGHPKAAEILLDISLAEEQTTEMLGQLWVICEPRTE